MPDPQLKTCIEEIKPILRKYDCVAIVMLQSQTHSEYLLHLDPEWSIVKFVTLPDGGLGLRVKAKRSEYPSIEAHQKAVSLGVGVLMGFAHMMNHLAEKLEGLVGVISQKTEIQNVIVDETDPNQRFKIE